MTPEQTDLKPPLDPHTAAINIISYDLRRAGAKAYTIRNVLTGIENYLKLTAKPGSSRLDPNQPQITSNPDTTPSTPTTGSKPSSLPPNTPSAPNLPTSFSNSSSMTSASPPSNG
jgi:hypothetical protein